MSKVYCRKCMFSWEDHCPIHDPKPGQQPEPKKQGLGAKVKQLVKKLKRSA